MYTKMTRIKNKKDDGVHRLVNAYTVTPLFLTDNRHHLLAVVAIPVTQCNPDTGRVFRGQHIRSENEVHRSVR